MLDKFFTLSAQKSAYHDLFWSHDPWLVCVSVALAIASSVMALHLAGLALRTSDAVSRHAIIASGAVALGGGVWAMHFVGMLAFELCASGVFDPWVTALSVLPSLLASWVALAVLAQEQVNTRSLLLGGLLVGAGIGVMHYAGMAASEFAPAMRYDMAGFAASIVFAVALATGALWVRFRLRQLPGMPRWGGTLLGGVVMGLAIAGMHYIAMAALRIVGEPQIPPASGASYLALAIAMATLVVGAVITGVTVNMRFRQLLRETRATASRMSALVNTAVDGILMIDGRGTVRLFNGAAERLLGWRADEVLGRNVNMLMPSPHRQAHDGYLHHHLTTGQSSIIGVGREIEAQRKDGTLVPMRLSVGRVDQPGEPLFVGFLVDLSGHRALEQERRRGEEQLRSLLGNLPGVAFRCLRDNNDWPMVFISDAVQQLTGWTAEDFVRGRVHFGAITHPKDVANIALEVEYALRVDQSYHIEFRIRTRDGQTRWVSENGRGVPDAQGVMRWIDGVILDITEVKARNAEFMGTVQAIGRSQAAAEFDLRGRLLGANPNFLALMGYSLDEIIGQPYAVFCTPDVAESAEYAAFWLRLAQGEFEVGEYQRFGKDGREVWMHATYNPIFDAEGRVFKIILFATDLSQRRAMEQDLRTAKERAEQAAAARSTFLANMSHEIRTPMNAIIGFTEALLDSSLDSTQRRHLGTVHHAARSMLRLLNDILDTAKLEKGAVDLEVEVFSLRELCDQILASLRITAAKKGLDLRLDYPTQLPEFWLGDAFRIQQVLLNLIGNAIKFTHQGSVTLRLAGRDGALRLDVLDTGIGIDEAGLKRVFDPFSQADASTTRRYGGTGLGTTIARQLTELMGGRITVASRLGEGSTFSVHLPLCADQGVAEGAVVAARGRGRLSLPPLRVLAVDDVPANLELLEITLQRSGHKALLAHSGADAVQAFQRERFDVVLMDLQMPDMDGLEATRRMRAFEQARQRKPTAIIALSASVLEQDRRNARAAGMDGFASKPLEPLRLMGEIARVLGVQGHFVESSVAALHTAAPAVPREPGALPAIDWERGLRLWTQARYLREAIERFLQDADATVGSLRAAAAGGEAQAGTLASAAHRLRGASANLALASVHKLAERLETAAHHPGHAAARPGLIDSLDAALADVRTALTSLDAPDAFPSGAPTVPGALEALGAPGTLAALDGAGRASVLAALDALAPALARGELLDGPLAVLEQRLPATSLQGLGEALDRFDFDDAQEHLRALRAGVAPT